MFDIKITGGTVVDGTGEAGHRADVGIAGDRIEAIGDLSQAEAGRTIDAGGLTVSPGFIDTHVHSDAALLTDQRDTTADHTVATDTQYPAGHPHPIGTPQLLLRTGSDPSFATDLVRVGLTSSDAAGLNRVIAAVRH